MVMVILCAMGSWCHAPFAEEITVKWLDHQVANYLEDGLPPQDYSQDESTFTKSIQGDINIGEMFYNFQNHKKGQTSACRLHCG